MNNIYSEILTALEVEENIMLATVVSTSGSTPASSLSKMIIKRDGLVTVGTIGGGCMEGEVIQHANRLYHTGKAEILSFELNDNDIETGLICGGTLDVLLEPLTRSSVPLVSRLQSVQDAGDDSLCITTISPEGVVTAKDVVPCKPQQVIDCEGDLAPLFEKFILASSESQSGNTVTEQIKRIFHTGATYRMKGDYGEMIIEPVRGIPGLIVFGGGHISKYISRIATLAGFRVTIVDDREKYANAERFPEAAQVLALDFGEALERLPIKNSTYVVIVTRGHQYDEEILKRVIKTPARYIGMIGSKRKVITTYENLSQRGIAQETLRQVFAPIGIEIGAVTAEEIAVSIVAQLISIRRENRILFHKSEELKNMENRFTNHEN